MRITLELSMDDYEILVNHNDSTLPAMNARRRLWESLKNPIKGYWIEPRQDDGMSDPICYQVRCSVCGFDLDPQIWHEELRQYGANNYCPNCGVRMEEKTFN